MAAAGLALLMPALGQPGSPITHDAARLARLTATLRATPVVPDRLSPDLRQLASQGLPRDGRVAPGLRLQGPLIQVEALAQSPTAARAALRALGMKRAAIAGYLVSGWLPVKSLAAAAKLPGIVSLRPGYVHARAAVTSEGDSALGGPAARSGFSVTGAGVTVGIISDSFDCLGGAVAGELAGELPGVAVLKELLTCEGGADEGRAMAEIVHDVAPGAAILFRTGFDGRADFAAGIEALRAAGADVIVDDVSYPAEPFFQDGVVARAVDAAVAQGAAYFAAAGNGGTESYDHAFVASSSDYAGGAGKWHAFDAASSRVFQAVNVPLGAKTTVALQWDEPYFTVSGPPGAASDLDLHLVDAAGAPRAGGITDNLGKDPVEVLTFQNDGTIDADGNGIPDTRFYLAIGHRAGPAPGRLKFVAENGLIMLQDWTGAESTLVGHANSAGAFAVGAANFRSTPAFGESPPRTAEYSSPGGTPILFDEAGARLATPALRSKPDAVAPDAVSTSFFGDDDPLTPEPLNFNGTSAAAPHAAGVAALLLEVAPGLAPAQLYARMKAGALDIGPPGVDAVSGAGLIQAPAVLSGGGPPVADAGEDRKIPVGQQAGWLYGTGSSDPDGDIAAYAWTQVAGPAARLRDGTSAQAAAAFPAVTTDQVLTFRLTVTDAFGRTSSDDVDLRLLAPGGGPVARAGADRVVVERKQTALNGTASFGRDAPIVSSQWRQVGASSASFTRPAQQLLTAVKAPPVTHDTELRFELTVTDANGNSDTDQVRRRVANVNQPPVVADSPDIEVVSGQVVDLRATATDPDGDTLSYLWECTSDNLRYKTRSPTGRENHFTAPVVDDDTLIECHLTVSDTAGETAADRTSVTVREDITPPTLHGIELITPTVDASSGDAVAIVEITVSDDNSGVDRIIFRLGGIEGINKGRCARPDAPSGCVTFHIPFSRWTSGTYACTFLEVFDVAGNTLFYSGDGPPPCPGDVVVTSDTADTTAPSLVSFGAPEGPLAMTEAGDGVDIPFNLVLNDDRSGVRSVLLFLISPPLPDESTPEHTIGLQATCEGVEGVSGDVTCPVTFHLSRFHVPGIWRVNTVIVEDFAEQSLFLDQFDFPYQGYSGEVEVTNATGCCADRHKPELSSVSVLTPTVDVRTGVGGEARIRVVGRDEVSGLVEVGVSLFGPAAQGVRVTVPATSCAAGVVDCTFDVAIPLSRFAASGEWRVDYVYMVDRSGQEGFFPGYVGDPRFESQTFQVIND